MAKDYFDEYCDTFGITDPFQEDQERFHKKIKHCISPTGREYWEVDTTKTPEEEEWELENRKKKDEYIRLRYIFHLWEFHNIMVWDDFQREIEFSKYFTDDWKRYLPCDCAGRQCAMTCTYFGTKCPRVNGEPLYPPEEVMKVWEEHDDGK